VCSAIVARSFSVPHPARPETFRRVSDDRH
jgi:hypothetical protein